MEVGLHPLGSALLAVVEEVSRSVAAAEEVLSVPLVGDDAPLDELVAEGAPEHPTVLALQVAIEGVDHRHQEGALPLVVGEIGLDRVPDVAEDAVVEDALLKAKKEKKSD